MKLSQRLGQISQVIQQKTPAPVVLPFKGWHPDQHPLGNPGEIEASGLFPAQEGYRPMPGLAAQSDALSARVRGATAAKNTSGDSYFYAGDASKLYEIRGQSATDKSGSAYSSGDEEGWEFAQAGNKIIACNINTELQSITIGGAGSFANHITGSDTPTARHMDIIGAGAGGGQFLMLGNVSDEGGLTPHRVRWSAIGDTTDFDESQTTQSDKEDLEGAGWVQRIVGGVEYGLIFLERRIDRAYYIGTPPIWRFDSVDRQRGTHVPNSVVPHGRNVFYFSEEGFFVQDGTQSTPIGDNKVDKKLDSDFDPANRHLVSAAVDHINKLVVWAFPLSSVLPNALICYHWPSGRWSHSSLATEMIVRAETQSFTLEDLDSLDAFSPDGIDTSGAPSLDSSQWRGGAYRLAAFNQSHQLAYFTGDNLAAQIIHGERQFSQGSTARLHAIRPLVDVSAGSLTCRTQHRRTQQASVTTSTETTVDGDGKAPVNVDARYHRIQSDIAAAATWSQWIGTEIEMIPGSKYGG